MSVGALVRHHSFIYDEEGTLAISFGAAVAIVETIITPLLIHKISQRSCSHPVIRSEHEAGAQVDWRPSWPPAGVIEPPAGVRTPE